MEFVSTYLYIISVSWINILLFKRCYLPLLTNKNTIKSISVVIPISFLSPTIHFFLQFLSFPIPHGRIPRNITTRTMTPIRTRQMARKRQETRTMTHNRITCIPWTRTPRGQQIHLSHLHLCLRGNHLEWKPRPS